MPRRSKRAQQDPTRRLVQGILTLVLTTLAGWLAAKLTDLILGPVKEPDEEPVE